MLDLAKLKERRERLGLSQEEAARKAGFKNRQQWWLIESGTRDDVTLSTLNKLATALGCKARDLLK